MAFFATRRKKFADAPTGINRTNRFELAPTLLYRVRDGERD
jgi:hypothetical protein